jgi:hypothetical protein
MPLAAVEARVENQIGARSTQRDMPLEGYSPEIACPAPKTLITVAACYGTEKRGPTDWRGGW